MRDPKWRRVGGVSIPVTIQESGLQVFFDGKRKLLTFALRPKKSIKRLSTPIAGEILAKILLLRAIFWSNLSLSLRVDSKSSGGISPLCLARVA
jgi:hypothetical protein